VAIKDYLEANGLEVAGDKSSSQAAYLLKIVAGIVIAIGGVITILSFFILLLSMSLLMEKNRDKLHSLLMLGVPVRDVERPYAVMVVVSTLVAYLLSAVCGVAMRGWYVEPLERLGADVGSPWFGLIVGLLLSLVMTVVNVSAVHKRVVKAWR
ncbi:MAG: hypothetical protein K2G29_02535, partial [Muribaculaceae bacterium]|nr:hypothetical protein [Muribaculaceae bacterium]